MGCDSQFDGLYSKSDPPKRPCYKCACCAGFGKEALLAQLKEQMSKCSEEQIKAVTAIVEQMQK